MAKITTTLFGELALLPYQAEVPVREKLEWLTDVLQAYDGSEQRLQSRTKPRQTLEYNVPLQYWKKATAFNTLYGAIRKDWAVPVWTEAQAVGDITGGQNTIDCDTLVHDLRADSLAMLFSLDGSYEIVEIESITATDVTIYGPGATSRLGAWLIPVRRGFIVGTAQMPTNGREGSVKVTFQIDDNLSLTPAEPAQYLGDDIYYDAGLLSESGIMTRVLQQRQDVIDFELGPVERRTPWNNARYSSPYASLLEGPTEVRAYKEFLYRRAGKFRAFWLPTFENDLRLLSTGTITSTMVVESASLIDYASNRTHIAIEDADGNWYPREISDFIQLDADRVQFTLSTNLNLDSDKIVRMSYLGLNRLDADQIAFNWVGNNVVKSEVRILEISP